MRDEAVARRATGVSPLAGGAFRQRCRRNHRVPCFPSISALGTGERLTRGRSHAGPSGLSQRGKDCENALTAPGPRPWAEDTRVFQRLPVQANVPRGDGVRRRLCFARRPSPEQVRALPPPHSQLVGGTRPAPLMHAFFLALLMACVVRTLRSRS